MSQVLPVEVMDSVESSVDPGIGIEADVLSGIGLFAGLSSDELQTIADECERIVREPGEVVVREKEPGDAFYMVLDGRLQVEQQSAEGTLRLGELRAGEYFGEIALLQDDVRTATVKALERSTLLVLSRGSLEHFWAGHPEQREQMRHTLEYRLQWMKTRRSRPSPDVLLSLLEGFLGELGRDHLSLLLDEVQWMAVPRGELLIREGHPGECMYFIVSGRLLVYVMQDGDEMHLAEVGAGEFLGEMSLLSSEPRSANARTIQDSELLRLSKEGFLLLSASHPRAMTLFAQAVVERLQRKMRSRAIFTQLRASPLLTEEECIAVTKIENLVLRNLKITQTYHRISQELTLLCGQQDANWCTFACHASKTAGYSIRKEELPAYELLELMRRIRSLRRPLLRLERLSAKGLAALGWDQLIEEVMDEVSEQVSAGNLKVYQELAPIFARMIQTFYGDDTYEPGKLAAFLDTLRAGPTEAGGQTLLKEALHHYYEAMFERDEVKRAEWIFLANCKVGLHEQMRLQAHIVGALNAPITVLLKRGLLHTPQHVVDALLPDALAGWLDRRRGELEASIAESVGQVWRRLATDYIMRIRLPYGELRLGRDLPGLPTQRFYPDVLQDIQNPKLLAFLKRFGPPPSDLRGSAATDWGDLHDRMGFIVHLFRSRQRSLELFDQPFLLSQRRELAADRLPSGVL